MILQPFTVNSHGKRFRFIDVATITSDADRDGITQATLLQVESMQDDAKCEALGIKEVGTIGNINFAVYNDLDDVLVGVFLMASIDYQSGPWADLVDWEVVDPSARIVLHGRPLPGFPLLTLDDSLDLSMDSAHHMLFRSMTTLDGYGSGFSRLSWAVHKDRTDPGSRAVQRVTDKSRGDARFAMTETTDPNDAALTRVDIELLL